MAKVKVKVEETTEILNEDLTIEDIKHKFQDSMKVKTSPRRIKSLTSNMSRQKYIAEGFHEDAGKLLNDFIEKCSVEFSDFASLWKEQYFSLVFMGRPDHTETCEFVNEIFRITTFFLSSPSFYQQVGAVYLLYALFRNQISVPPVKIRLPMNHWRIIKDLRVEAILKSYKTLHYVIDFLMKEAFVYVASQTLKGPLIGNMVKVSKNHEIVSNLKTSYKADVTQYSINNSLVELRDLHIEYLDEKRKMGDAAKVALDQSSKSYEKLISDLHELVNPFKARNPQSLGDRRAKLKAQSFFKGTKDRFGVANREDSDSSFEEPKPKKSNKGRGRIRIPRRVPKHERRVGRPSKKPKPEPKKDKDDVLDISHLVPQQQAFYLPPMEYEHKKSRIRREPYYKHSPPRRESHSSDDADEIE